MRSKKTSGLSRNCLILSLLLLALVIGGGAAVVMRGRRPQKGVVIHPEQDWRCPSPVYFSQTDPRWGSDLMGESPDTMKQSGCLVTCLAASMRIQSGSRDPGPEQMTPGTLNQAFSDRQIYDKRGNILWNPLRDYLADGTVLTPTEVDAGEVEKLLRDGRYPIAKVKMPVSRANHWVVLLWAKDGEYYCMDPLNEKGDAVPLSKYEDTVYAVRCVDLNH